MLAKQVSVNRPVRCVLCKKPKGLHLAGSLHCPAGMKTRIGYLQYSPTNVYTLSKRAQKTVEAAKGATGLFDALC